MDPIDILRSEHENIGVELDELDFIIESSNGGVINYSNLVHTFWKLCEAWQNHEKMEEELFKVMGREGFEIPIQTILLEHENMSGRVERISDAINSGNDFEVRKVLEKEVRELVDIIRKHSEMEENILSGVILDLFSEGAMEEMKGIIGKWGEESRAED
jgi:hemerythrin-like domain-containing protein